MGAKIAFFVEGLLDRHTLCRAIIAQIKRNLCLTVVKNRPGWHYVRLRYYFCPTFRLSNNSTDMENIQNTRGKGYCLLYLFMFLFFFTALVLMLYNRSFVLDFAR